MYLTYPAERVAAALAAGTLLTVRLRRGESAWHPACTTCALWGPATVTYRRHPDGGVDATVAVATRGARR